MRKIIITIFALFMSLSSLTQAKDITLIINGKPGGTFFQRINLYADGLEARGWEVNTVTANYNGAIKIFNESKTPVAMVWTDQMSSVYPISATNDNFVLIEYQGPLYLCNITGKQEGKVGIPKMYPKAPINKLGSFTFVPYKNTGAVLNAVVAGEIDFAYMNQSKASKVEKMGYKCDSLQGLEQNGIVFARNVDLESFRQELLQVLQTQGFVDFHTKAKFVTSTRSDREGELDMVQTSTDKWKQ